MGSGGGTAIACLPFAPASAASACAWGIVLRHLFLRAFLGIRWRGDAGAGVRLGRYPRFLLRLLLFVFALVCLADPRPPLPI